mgnify:CR=1 FL=1
MKFKTVLAIFFYLVFSLNLKAENHSVLNISDNDFFIGSDNAPVTIIEYASMSCSHCADFHNNTLDDLKSEYIDTGKVRFVFRDFPFNYPALAGSMIVGCVPEDVKYQYMNALYKLQNNWIRREHSDTRKELYKIMQSAGMQQDEFDAAFIYSKALDKRLNENGHRIYELANIAHKNQAYKAAIDAYEYLIKKGNSTYLLEAKILKVIAKSERILSSTHTKNDLEKIDNEYQDAINELGINISTAYLIKEYAHLQGFYLYNSKKAVSLLEECINITMGEAELQAECKLELADILLMQGDPWEAILLYSQVEKDFKENPIGHEAKFRRARISYFQGEFDWAQAQLDVLKASTSKLIANNAMDLSLLITDNMGLDTSAKAMQMYARAEFLAFQNKWEASTNTLDSLLLNFSGHTLSDEVIYKKAEISMHTKKYNQAISYFQDVAENYSYDILADDALFQWAKLTEEHLNDNEKALMLYEQILLEHNGSIYTSEARKRFRALRGDNENIAQ